MAAARLWQTTPGCRGILTCVCVRAHTAFFPRPGWRDELILRHPSRLSSPASSRPPVLRRADALGRRAAAEPGGPGAQVPHHRARAAVARRAHRHAGPCAKLRQVPRRGSKEIGRSERAGEAVVRAVRPHEQQQRARLGVAPHRSNTVHERIKKVSWQPR